jgi:hypothetical protein
METKAVCKDLDVVKDMSKKIDAIKNENRLKLLIIIGKETNKAEEIRKSTYLRKLAHYLTEEEGIVISLTAIKNHLTKLLDAGLIKKEAGFHNEMPVKNYVLIPGALEALSMDISTLNSRITHIQDEISKSSYQLPLIKVLGGSDDGKIFPLVKDSVKIGRKGEMNIRDPEYQYDIILSNSYESVSRVFKPHATLKLEGGSWIIEDNQSKCGFYINNGKQRLKSVKLNNRDKIRLALGDGGAELVFISKI